MPHSANVKWIVYTLVPHKILVECFASQSTNVSCIIVSVESPLTNIAYISVTASALAVFCGMSISLMSLGKISMWSVFLSSWSQLAWSSDNITFFSFARVEWLMWSVTCLNFHKCQSDCVSHQPFCPKGWGV